MIIVDDFEQSSPQWHAARMGNPGASTFHKIIGKKGERSESRDGYMKDLAGEIVTGRPSQTYQSWRMKSGIENEAESRDHYAFQNGVDVAQVAMCYRNAEQKYHCSPDGLRIKDKIGFETKDHTETPRIQIEQYDKSVPSTHWIQCQGSLLVTGYNAWDYRAYCIGMEPFDVRIYPDDKWLQKLEKELDAFCMELAMMVRKLKERRQAWKSW